MPIVECELCGKKYRMGPERAGSTVPCRECGSSIRVPGQRRSGPRQSGPADDSESSAWLIWAGGGAVVVALLIGLGLYFALRGGEAPPVASTTTPDATGISVSSPVVASSGNKTPAGSPAAGGFAPAATGGSGTGTRQPATSTQTSPSKTTGGGGFRPTDANIAPPVSSLPWKVSVDPPAEPVVFESKRKLRIAPPDGTSNTSLLFPTAPSVYVAIGSNMTDAYARDIYNLSTHQKVGTVTGLRLSGEAALSPDGRYLAGQISGSEGLLVWDVKQQKPLGELPLGDSGTPPILDFAGPDRVIGAGRSGTLKVWALPSGDLEREIPMPAYIKADSVAISPGGRYLTVEDKKALKIFDLTTGQLAGELPMPKLKYSTFSPKGVSFSPDGQEFGGLFSAGIDESLMFWDVATGRQTARIDLAERLANSIPQSFIYSGPVVAWFPGRERLLLLGRAVFDRQRKSIVWNTGGEDARTPRQILGPDKLAVLEGPFNGKLLTEYELPQEEIAKAVAAVASGGTAADANLPPITEADYSGMRTIELKAAAGGWNVQADPAPVPESPLLPRPIQLNSSRGHLTGLFLSGSAGARAVVSNSATSTRSGSGSSRAGKSNSGPPVWLDVYDLAAGSRIKSFDIPFASDLLAVSPDGSRALTRIAETQDRLDVWDLNADQHISGWRPFLNDPEKQGGLRLVSSSKRAETWAIAAAFVDEQHVLTMDSHHNLTLWQLPACRAVYRIEGAGKPGLSPNGRWLVVSTGGSFRFFDARTGSPAGDLQSAGSQSVAAFHPDGRRFAVIFHDSRGTKLINWDLQAGQILKEFPLPALGQTMQWCGDDHLLIDGRRLIDMKREMIVWNYQIAEGVQAPVSPDDRHWFLAPKTPRGTAIFLNARELPDQSVRDQIAQRNPRPTYLIEPGSKVKLQVDLSDPPGQPGYRKTVLALVRQKMIGHGFLIDDNASLVVQMSRSERSTGKMETFRVTERRGFSIRNRTVETVNIPQREVICSVKILQGDDVLWQRESRFNNTTLHSSRLKEGESAQSHLTEAMHNSASRYFLSFDPPAYIFPKGAEDGLGTSLLH